MATNDEYWKAEISRLIDTALGEEKSDLVLKNGTLLDVYTGELLENISVAIKGSKIAYVGRDASHTISSKTRVIDAKDMTLIPGLIDAHAHMFWYYNVDEVARYAIKSGTTTIIADTTDIVCKVGYSGVSEFLNAIREQPIKIFVLISMGLSYGKPAQALRPNIEEYHELLKHDSVIGVGEVFWQYVIQKDERTITLLSKALSLGKKVEGHAAGARNEKLVAYVSSGVSSCHEAITADEVVERLRLGLCTMIREGSVRRELKNVCNVKDMISDFRKLCLVTDGLLPKDLLEKGYMDYVVQEAIDLGFDPIKTIQMVTINPAQHFLLDDFVGGIAPGKYADILLIPNLKEVRPKLVISNGAVVMKDGELLIQPRKPEFHVCRNIVHLPRKVLPSDFFVHATVKEAKVRAIKFVAELITRETQVILPISNGLIKCDPEDDVLKVAVVDRILQPGKVFTGFVMGFGMKRGALATSVGWETASILVVGANEEDMANAVNRVVELGGGIALSLDGVVVAELPLPIAGMISDLPMDELAQRLNRITTTLKEIGCPFRDPHLTLTTITTPAIPFIKICEEGLVDVRRGELLDLIVESK